MMWRTATALLAAVATVLAIGAAEVVHVHDVAADANHQHDTGRVHAHHGGHDHGPAAPASDESAPGTPAWSIDGMLSQPAVMLDLQLPIVADALVEIIRDDDPGRPIDAAETRAHDPPPIRWSPLRAPPHVLPALS
jgi:hypothetical protein